MGNQIACDIGADYIEFAVSHRISDERSAYQSAKSSLALYNSIEFFSILKSEVIKLKELPVFQSLDQNSIPVNVSGITYDSFFEHLSELFQYPIDRSKNFNYTVLSVGFLWENLREQLFEYELLSVPPDGSISVAAENYVKVPVKTDQLYPYLLVSVKSGVSIYKVTSANECQKIGGSCLGLNSIWALLKGNGSKSFEQLISDAEFGDSSNVDMTVRDIYGTRYLNLPEKITASSCGKLKDFPQFETRDLTFSMLFMLLFNLGQISAMHCYDLNIETMVVVGSVFVSEFVNRLMRFTLNYYSQGKLRMVFCENSRYLRCLGMFLYQQRVKRFNTL